MSDSYQLVSDACVAKTKKSVHELVILGLLSGAFLAFAGATATMVAFNLLANPDTFGLGRLVAGTIFPCGLILVAITGAELFTGNTMMLLPLAQRRITLFSMLSSSASQRDIVVEWAICHMSEKCVLVPIMKFAADSIAY